MTPSRMRQRTLFEFVDVPPVERSNQTPGRETPARTDSEDERDDPGSIQFEREASDINKPQKPRSPPVTYIDSSKSSSSEIEQTPRKRLTRSMQSQRRIVASDESESQQPRKRPRLVKGKRPESGPSATESDGDLLEEVDEGMILDSRLRDRSKKSAFVSNLEKLRNRRRGHVSLSESDEGASDDSESSPLEGPSTSEHIKGARPSIPVSDDNASAEESSSDNVDDDDFIVEDDCEEALPALPTMFSMDTFQDLSHHFKVICQLFVHLAVKKPLRRRSFMKEVIRKDYFSVPLAIIRRKLSGIKDSLVTSSIWKPDFKHPLETLPIFRLEGLEFTIPMCDACHMGKRIATLRGIVSGYEYDPLTYEPHDSVEETEEEPNAVIWNLGRFCAARAQTFHSFSHWEYNHYHSLLLEIDRLRDADGEERTGRRVFIPASSGPPPPDDPDDADGVMDWLDGRGIIDAEWAKMKAMMERAHNLEAKIRRGEDDISEEW